MGRLDEHAKKRIVELRNAGLSFRKIKKVLELDNIRVTPQAVYLFLKRKHVDPEQLRTTTTTTAAAAPQVRGSRNPWEDEQLWNLLNDSGSEQNKRKDPGTSIIARPGAQTCLGRQHSPDIQQVQNLGRQHVSEGQQGLIRQQGPDIQQAFGRQHATEGQQGPGRQQGPEGQQGLGWQQGPEEQQSLGRKQSFDGQQGIRRQQGLDGQQALGRQQGIDGHQTMGRQQGLDGQQSIGRQQSLDGQQSIGRQQGLDGQQGVGRQQGLDGQQGVGRQQGLDGQQGVGRQQGLDGQQGVGRQQGLDGQQGVGWQKSLDGQQGVRRQQSPNGPQGFGRQQGPDGHQGLIRQQGTDGQQTIVRQQCPEAQQSPRPSALPSGGAVSHEISDNKDDIKIVSVTSLCEDNRQFGKASVPIGPCPGIQLQHQPKKSDCPVRSTSQSPTYASRPPPVMTINPQQQLNGRGRMPFVAPRNPALIVRKKIVDRAIHFQKKVNLQNGQAVSSSAAVLPFLVGVPPSGQSPRMNHSTPPSARSRGTHVMDVSTQTIPTGAAGSLSNQNIHWSGQPFAQSPGASSKAVAEKLEAVHADVQKLTQALHAIAERQNRMERQHEQQQQRFQQEVLGSLQQISSLFGQQQQQQLCHAQSPLNQACLPYGNIAEATPALPSFGQFKMELL